VPEHPETSVPGSLPASEHRDPFAPNPRCARGQPEPLDASALLRALAPEQPETPAPGTLCACGHALTEHDHAGRCRRVVTDDRHACPCPGLDPHDDHVPPAWPNAPTSTSPA
jgi:hypothetical protein